MSPHPPCPNPRRVAAGRLNRRKRGPLSPEGRERLRQRVTRRGLGSAMGSVALLAPAVVPPRLLTQAVGNLAGPVPAPVQALAAGWTMALRLRVMGAAFLVLIDTVARTAARIEIPLGLLTALLGAPVFVWLLARGRRSWS